MDKVKAAVGQRLRDGGQISVFRRLYYTTICPVFCNEFQEEIMAEKNGATVRVQYVKLEREDLEKLTLPGGDVITMAPGVPKLGTPEFDTWLADWNEVHNPKRTAAPSVQPLCGNGKVMA
jgi:hypothetical protein